MRQYFEYFVMFKRMDKSGDGRVGLDEFKQAVPQLNKWGAKITNPEATFKKIDVNGGGTILFEEFSHFSIAQKLDLEDDGDDKEFEEAAKNLEKDAEDPSKPKKYRHYQRPKTVEEQDQESRFVRDLKFSDINWDKMKRFFPVSKSENDKAARKKQFSVIDMNGNGYASLAEIDRFF